MQTLDFGSGYGRITDDHSHAMRNAEGLFVSAPSVTSGHPEIHFAELISGFPNIPPEAGASLTHAALICLDHHKHESGVRLSVDGDFSMVFKCFWTAPLTEATRRYWNDLEEATEHGAVAVAILLIRALTGYTIIERARKGTGIDWWLGTDDDLFQGKARLEVSGILQGDTKALSQRVSRKKDQTKQSDPTRLPAYVVVVEFSCPRSSVVKR